MVLHGQAFGSFRKLLIAGASVVALALLVPQARSLNKGSDFSEDVDSTSVEILSEEELPSVADQGLRPLPPSRVDVAKRSINDQRNPFLVQSRVGVDGEASLNSATIAAGLESVRLTGVVQEGSSLRALVDDGSTQSSLALGDHLALGSLQGLGFRVVSISFDRASISISNGRSEHQIFAPQ